MEHSIIETFNDPVPEQKGGWYYAYRDDLHSTIDGPFDTEAATLAALKDCACSDSETDIEMVILRITKRLRVFQQVEEIEEK